MEFGAHLPVLRMQSDLFSASQLRAYAALAEEAGFTFICANDHILAASPWLDGLAALVAAAGATQRATLVTTVALPVLRGPPQLAKFLTTLDVLSDGRVVAGVGSGNSPLDFAVAGVPFEQRRERFGEAICVLRSLLSQESEEHQSRFYPLDGARLQPPPIQKPGIPVWVASGGSDEGLRQVALADGWLSAYVTPEIFSDARERLNVILTAAGRDPSSIPNAVGSMFFYITDSRSVAETLISRLLSPALDRPARQLRERLLIGPVDECVEKLARLQEVGVQRAFVWPVTDELDQLAMFSERVMTQLPSLPPDTSREPTGILAP